MTCTIISTGEELNLICKNENEPPYLEIKAKLHEKIWNLYCKGYDTFWLNCEYGVPLWCGEIITALAMYNDIELNIAMPYEEQSTNWVEEHRDRFFAVHADSDHVELISNQYTEDCYELADEHMIDSWEERYQDLKSYLTEHNMTSVPKSTIDRNGYDLYYWVSDQRRAYKSGKLTQEQMQKLDDIGYPFYADSSSRQKKLQEKWRKNYEIVLEYSEAHKGEYTPKAVVYKGVSIVSWLSNQQVQFRKGKMIPERIELLKKIKINSFSFETDQRMEDKNGE